jgi:hypothetical protein
MTLEHHKRQIQEQCLPVMPEVLDLGVIPAPFGWIKEGLLKQLVEVVL